jgi:DNA-binding IclR family transcriptional regulator
MLALLLQQPGQTVSAIALRLNQPLSVASTYLRALESRGLLTAHRNGRWVKYRPNLRTTPTVTTGLTTALDATFKHESKPIEAAFRRVTAFTHPRRIEIFRALQAGPLSLAQLRTKTGISGWALGRQLKKLGVRGFVRENQGLYTTAEPKDELGRELARLATT